MDNEYLHGDVLKIFPWIKPRTLISWSERGLLRAEFGEADGRGSSRVFSYTNLIEIGILSELLQNGVPFSVIRMITESEQVRDTLAQKAFNNVVFFQRQLVSSDVPMNKTAPWIGFVGSLTLDEFVKNSRSLAMNLSTLVLINIGSIKRFIDARVKKLR